MRKRLAGYVLVIMLLGLAPLLARAAAEAPDRGELERQVRRELARLPFYTVFDHLEARVEDARVTLFGSVSRPALREEAEEAVGRLEGVAEIGNRIRVLPGSAADDRLRLALYRTIYAPDDSAPCARSDRAVRILVANGEVTLTGCVDSEAARARAESLAANVPGAAAVNNRIEVSGLADPAAMLAASRAPH